jgi:hypothetical protein
MNEISDIHLTDYTNPLATKDTVSLDEYLTTYKSRITQESEELFVRSKIKYNKYEKRTTINKKPDFSR